MFKERICFTYMTKLLQCHDGVIMMFIEQVIEICCYFTIELNIFAENVKTSESLNKKVGTQGNENITIHTSYLCFNIF